MTRHEDPDDSAERWQRARARFPYLEHCVYLNTAAAGVSWDGQGAAAAAFFDDAKSRGFNGMATWRCDGLAKARAALARMLAVSEDEIGFTGSTTEGLNLAMNAVTWRTGDEIVLAHDEFPSVILACEGPRRLGAQVRPIPISSESNRESVLIDALTSRTRVLAVSHVHWGTGTRLDLERLASACRLNQTLLIVDGVQALGAVEPRLGDTAVYCASTFKWLLSGFGLAVMVVRSHAREAFSPIIRGYSNPPPSHDFLYAHVNHPGLYALAASLEFIERDVGWPSVYGRVNALASELITRLEGNGFGVTTPTHSHAGIVSCAVARPDGVRDALASRNVYVESREGLLRASPHFYNTHQEIEAYVKALTEVVAPG